MKKEIIVYTNSTCGACKAMKDLLDEENIKFVEKIKDEHLKEWGQIVQLTGLGTFPTINIGDDYFIPGRDFQSHTHFVTWLKDADLENERYSDNIKVLQALKTLTFSINNIFGRIFQDLAELKKQKDEHKSTD